VPHHEPPGASRTRSGPTKAGSCEHFRSPTEFPTTNANQRESLRDATFAGVFREPTLFVSDLFSSSASHLIHHFYCF
jgi:hypothetical protein